jgi:hypothetical protein
VAKEKGIDTRIKCSPRQRGDPPSDTTLSNAICGIIGAAWLDSRNVIAPFKAIEVFGYVDIHSSAESGKLISSLSSLGESQQLGGQGSIDPQHTTISHDSPSNQGNIAPQHVS